MKTNLRIILSFIIAVTFFFGISSEAFAATVQKAPLKVIPFTRKIRSANMNNINPGGLEGISLMQAPLDQQDKYNVDLFSGSGTYNYPIKLPKGTDELTPSLSLNYANQAAHDPSGYVGSGWEYDYPYITTNAQYFPSNPAGFTYNLHFQGQTYDLVYVASDGLYHTKIESHFNIQKIATGGQNNDGSYWTLTTTDGTVYRFGYSTSSELPCSGQGYQYKWAADQVQDLHNNHIYYSYTQSSGQIYLTKISYNNDNAREVDLNYVTNPYQKQYNIQGCSVLETNRLSTIQVKANGSLVHEYDLAFNQAGNGQNLLTSITEKGTDGSSLPPVKFTYNAENQTFNSTPVNYAPSDLGALISNADLQMCDMTGNGFPDVVLSPGTGGGTWNVHINNGGQIASAWTSWGNIPVSLSDNKVRLLDVNGDGRCDVVQSTNINNTVTYNVWLNNGSQFTGPYTWVSVNNNNNQNGLNDLSATDTTLLDINGDGLPDIVHMGPQGWEVLFNTGSGWSTSWVQWQSTNVPNFSWSDVRVMDVNGDGLPDVIQSTDNGNCYVTWQVWKNTGNGYVSTPETWINNAQVCVRNDRTDTAIIDLHGDGLPDLVQEVSAPNNNWTMQVLQNTGSGWSTTFVPWVTGAFNQDFANTKFVDMNGDGLADVLYSNQQWIWNVYKNQGYAPENLASVATQQGGNIAYQYVPSTNFSNGGNLPFPVWVVSAKTQDNGMTNIQHTSDVTQYSYVNGLYSYLAHEFRGFGTVNETNPNGAKIQTLFGQGDALKGKAYQAQTTDASNNLYSQVSDTWNSSQTNGVYTDTLNQELQYTYDGSVNNPKVKETDYLYDQYGNVTKQSDMGDTSLTGDEHFTYNVFDYNPAIWLVNKVSDNYVNKADDATKVSETWNYFDGNTSLTTPPTKGDLTKQVKWLNGGTNPTTQFTYDSYGNQTQVTDPNNNVTQYAYGIHDATHTYADHLINAKNQTFDTVTDLGTGNVLLKTDPNGFTTSYVYDPFGRISKEIDPYDSSTYPTINYQYFNTIFPQGSLVSKRQTSGSAGTLDSYLFADGLGRTIQTRTPAQNTNQQIVTDIYYDPNGKVSKKSVPHLDTLSTIYATPLTGIESTNTTYDPLMRILTVTNPQGTSKSSSYDHWTQTDTDENSNTKKTYFDAYNNILQVDEHNNGQTYSTKYVYDAQNNLTKITDNENNITTFAFDTLNRRTSQVDPDMGTWTYVYDGDNNLTQLTDNRGKVTTKTYDPLNRVANISYPVDPAVTYTYDTNTLGTLAQVQDAAGTVTYTYDNRLRKTQEQRVTDGITWTTSYTYDASDRMATQTNPDGEVLTYSYNPQGEIGQLNGIVNTIDYNALGQTKDMVLANTLTTNFTYNTNDFRLSRIQTGSAQDVSYTYDNVGNVQSITNNLLGTTQSFTYDNLYRLLTASEPNGYNYTYGYNDIGNLTKFINGSNEIDYTYGQNAGPHALTSSTETVSPTPTPTNTPTPTPTPPPSSIQLDGTIQSTRNAGGNLTLSNFAVTGSNANRFLLVAVGSHQGGGTTGATSVTYGGTAMTLLSSTIGQYGEFVQFWGLQAPAGGTGNIVTSGISGGDFTFLSAYSLYNVKQIYTVQSASLSQGNSSSTVNITPNSANNWIIDAIESEPVPSVSGSNVQDWSQEGVPNSYDNGAGSRIKQTGGPTSVAMSWNLSYGGRSNQDAVALEPTTGSPTPTPTPTPTGTPTPTPTPSCNNLVSNPSFETPAAGNTVIPTSWTSYNTAGTQTYKGNANDFANDGSQSFKISATANTDTGIWTQISGLTVGQPVSLSVFVKTDANVTNANVVLDTNQMGIGGAMTQTVNVGANNNSRVSINNFVPDKTAVNIFLGLGSFGGQSIGTVWYDSVKLEKGTSSTSYCPVSTLTPTPTPTPTNTPTLTPTPTPTPVGSPQLIQKNLNTIHASSNAVSFTSNVTTGNTILVAITQWGQTVSTVSDNHSNTYTAVTPAQHANSSSDYVELYYAKNVTGGSTTVTVAFAEATDTNVGIYEYSGLNKTSTLDQIAANTGYGNAPNGGTLTTTLDNEVYFAVGVDDNGNNTTPTAGSGYTLENHQDDSTSHERFYTEDRVSNHGSYSTDFSIATSSNWAVIGASFK